MPQNVGRDRLIGAEPGPVLPDPQIAPWSTVVIDRASSAFEPKAPERATATGYVPDTVCEGWSSTFATVRAASVRGRSHRYYATARQDAMVAKLDPAVPGRSDVRGWPGAVVLAVADGVSSAELSAYGAQRVCESAVQAVLSDQALHNAEHIDWPNVIDFCVGMLRNLTADRLGTFEFDDDEVGRLFATTLVVGVATPSRNGRPGLRIDLCRVGDSNAWVLTPRRRLYEPVFGTKRDGAQVIASVVRALPCAGEHVEHMALSIGPDCVLLVGTDGFGDPLGDGDEEVGALFAANLGEPPLPTLLAHLLDFSRESFDDDRTLLALWPRQKEGE